MKKYFSLLTGLTLLFLACSEDDNGIDNPNPNPPVSADFPVQDFMWQAMNLWYFWQAEVPNLADDRFSTDAEFVEFIQSQSDEEAFLRSLLFTEDRFTFWNENYKELVSNLSGVSKSNGLEFGLVQFSGSNDIFGYVQYIQLNSDAASKDISRGEIFTRVDGQQLNLDNYIGLLFGDNDTYTLGMADIANGQITDNTKEVTLTKVEGFEEDPILVAETLDVGGTKVAYLMYNRFLSSFNEELNAAFAQFVAEGATELVLDMRYNPGGSVNTSRLLASMVYGTNTDELYIRQRWNSKIQGQLSAEQLEDYFADTTGSTPISSLNLNRVFVLATNSSASASELVMNGLAPYVNVIHIGETTRGKNEFSITLVDDPGNSFIYSSTRENVINSDNSWGLQPLVGRNENANGFFDYTDGLAPDIELEEDLSDLGVLGDPNEPLLARALEEITGVSTKKGSVVLMPAKAFTGSALETPLKDIMYLDKPLNLK
ncbi:S41 family peptidase [Flagellimonas allohymeniacidonis]|uniref:Carboxyl-terminal protease n=1 Tax=Flagellimonas allohymeniacidonis TaxID=2517819 RepID=A0A4Q8QGU8_9FLAO|nr:S41 family peptidase [Allomuricauda hymeniacidonis]TAI49144.1 carboxyl-terminal protease [Allomuricauda hymeniacidonis]